MTTSAATAPARAPMRSLRREVPRLDDDYSTAAARQRMAFLAETYAAGGVRTTVVADVMQRAPAFGFDSAREVRAFGDWVTASFAAIKAEAEATTHVGRLHDIEQSTYGGGTGLPTQRECLELLGCYGSGQVHKFAEIVAATVLCGEISLGAAVVADEWVTAHERLGRNRP